MSSHRKIDKQIVVYSYNAIVHSNQKEQTADIYNNIDESNHITIMFTH